MEVKKFKRNRGISTMEVVTAISLSVLATFILADTTILAAQTFRKVGEVATAHTFGRRAFDRFIADAQAANLSMAKFPAWSSSPWHVAKENQCVIFRQPKFKADMTVDPENFKVIVYKIEAAATAADGPFVLKRWECPLRIVPAGSSSASNGTPQIVAKNIKSVKWNQFTNLTYWGDRYTKDYYMRSTPEADTNEIKLKALIGGVDRIASGHATVSGTKVTLFKAMEYGVAMDVTYHTDPDLSLDYTANNGASGMYASFVFQPRWTDKNGATKTRQITLSAMPTFDNKEE